jgi:Carboxypeptidase regulatory-like domain
MSSRGLTLVGCAVLVLVFSSAAAAQTGAVLSGVVYDRTGEPVSGVVLTIIDPVTADIRVAISDHRGMYSVDRLQYAVQYAVDVRHPRFRKSRVRARANEGEIPFHIALASPRSRFVNAALFPLRVVTFGAIGQTRGHRYLPSAPHRDD